MIKSLTEKKGRTRTLGRDSISFQNFINDMRWVDAEIINGTFTWKKRRGGASQVASKLDKFMISEALFLTGPDMFENVWLSHPDFTINIDKWWMEEFPFQGTKMFMLQQRLKHIKVKLKYWNRKQFDNIFEAKKDVEQKLQGINQLMITEGFNEERKSQADILQKELDDRCRQEEIFWRQKLRVQWIKEGEINTKFFHKSTLSHRSHNIILKLKDSQGKELVTHKEMESIPVQHFLRIAKEPLLDRSQFINKFTRYIPKIVTREDDHNLNRSVSEDEIREVINELQNGKAPGPDGFNVDFFKACWKIVKQDILEVVEDSIRSRSVLKALNNYFIALIPKKEKAITSDRFRPIALCNVEYIIISKLIANKLKPLLLALISEDQIAYVEGR
eukprot:PITA_09251